jgi:RNA polymerase sigma-70 factor (ECF subfamily)
MTLSDTDLIVKAQRGDNSAFEELIYRYDRNVLSLAFKFVNNRDDAKDIYQEVFIRVFKSLKNFQFRSEFSTWLYRITTNVCLSFKKKQSRHHTVSINDDDNESSEVHEIPDNEGNSPERYVHSSEISSRINGALENLSQRQKMVFILKNYEGYKIKEIAVVLDCNEGTVKKYLFDANNKLRKYLSDFD